MPSTNEQTLYKVYYEDHNFWGRVKLFEITQSKGLNVSRQEVKNWLRVQSTFKSFNKINQHHGNGPFIVRGFHLSSDHRCFFQNGLCGIVGNKSAEDVKKGIQKILNKLPKKPRTILPDNGTEFKNQILTNILS